ncbi:MAG: hypothetical protein IT439_10080 [Phycisphaerales bacterium]|nr:hypothetical protein [Phycisphaerales bacterium]
MIGDWFRRRFLRDLGAAYRAQHSAWLTRAASRPLDYPRIPTRAVHLGGFDRLLETPEGRVVVEWWWRHTLESLDESH